MDSSASRVGSGEINQNVSPPPPSNWKIYAFAIAIIVGLGGLAVGGVGLAGCFHIENIHAILTMAVGVIFVVVGVVGTAKNCPGGSHNDVRPENGHVHPRSVPTINREVIPSIDIQGGLIYGAEAWKVWNIEVLDVVPATPVIDWQAKDPYFNQAYSENYVLLYWPEKVRVNGKEQDFDPQAVKAMGGDIYNCLIGSFSQSIEAQCEKRIAPGWRLVSKKLIPDSRQKTSKIQKEMVEEKAGFRMLYALEAIVLNLMVFAFTGERLFGQKPWTYTRCIEKDERGSPIVVGGFGDFGLYVYDNFTAIGNNNGVAVLRTC